MFNMFRLIYSIKEGSIYVITARAEKHLLAECLRAVLCSSIWITEKEIIRVNVISFNFLIESAEKGKFGDKRAGMGAQTI